ncbi:MAG: Hsp70 family protein [Rickettsiales bacterium]|jgi:hypothetical chaperone protein|nr:Hsp70 family protein [Rickettsiales bacterium]
MSNAYAGIDFGTTNTTAAVAGGGMAPHIVPIENNDVATPSAIFFEEKTGRVFFGRAAMQKYMNADPGRFMRSLKRVLGTNLMMTGTIINGRPWTFQDILGTFMENVKARLDAAAGQSIEHVVMGRPVHFRDNDPTGDALAEKELEQIAKKSGFKEVLFQYEPIAGALAHEQLLREEMLAAVIDIGGGTSDFSIIRLGGDRAGKADRKDDILANTGVRIGGNDFDKRLSLESFMQEFGKGVEYNSGTEKQPKLLPIPTTYFFDLSEWSHVNSLYTHKNINMVNKYWKWSGNNERLGRLVEVLEHELGHKVLAMVEDTKISLTDLETLDVLLNFLSSKTKIPVTRKEFERAIAPQAVKILDSVNECARLSGVKFTDVQLIVLTGGSTEIPYIRDTLCRLFPNAKVSSGEKLSSVGLGLAFDAIRRFEKNSGR